MDLSYRVEHLPEYQDPTKLADFKRRTGRMDKIMAKLEQEMCNFIRKKMLLLEKEHKKLFT